MTPNGLSRWPGKTEGQSRTPGGFEGRIAVTMEGKFPTATRTEIHTPQLL
jgi:hypothetical protein